MSKEKGWMRYGAVRLHTVSPQKIPYLAFVDEAGDRGWGGRSSPVFVLSAVVVPSSEAHLLRSTLNRINASFGRQPQAVLHWAENIREHHDRKYVARELAELPAAFINVVVCKSSLMGSGTTLSQSSPQYTYPMRRLIERVSWYVNKQGGAATLRVAHVRRFKYEVLHNYLDYVQTLPNTIEWGALKNGTRPEIGAPQQVRGLQIADMVAGSVYAAVRPDCHGDHESAYLEAIQPRLWYGPTRKLQTYGLNFIRDSAHDCSGHYPWLSALANAR